MQHQFEVAGDDEALVDTEGRIGQAPGPAQHHRHGRKRLQPGALIDEFERAPVERVHAQPDAERIEDGSRVRRNAPRCLLAARP